MLLRARLIKCPNCGKSYFKFINTTCSEYSDCHNNISTKNAGIIFKDGKVQDLKIDTPQETICETFECLECNHIFSATYNYNDGIIGGRVLAADIKYEDLGDKQNYINITLNENVNNKQPTPYSETDTLKPASINLNFFDLDSKLQERIRQQNAAKHKQSDTITIISENTIEVVNLSDNYKK